MTTTPVRLLHGLTTLILFTVTVGLVFAGCDEEGQQQRVTSACSGDSDCDGGVCFDADCFIACTRQSDCEENEFCATQISSTGETAELCVSASAFAGCGADEDCAAIVTETCGTATCDLESTLCAVSLVEEGTTCTTEAGAAGACAEGQCVEAQVCAEDGAACATEEGTEGTCAEGQCVARPDPCTDEPGSWACACETNDECQSGYCVEGASGDGRICSVLCVENCPDDAYTCQQTGEGPDVTYLCLPAPAPGR
jgi:hypothetical protein